MKLSKLKQLLINKNNQFSENPKRVSSVRSEFERELIADKVVKSTINTETYTESKTILELGSPSVITDDVQYLPSYFESSDNQNNNKIDSIKIIGITGSRGKSTTAYIVHEYLKSLGYKSILYSSVCVDSPFSYKDPNEPCEVSIQNEDVMLEIIEEAEAYGADYLVLEINESTISKGLTNDIPFSIRALTNIIPYHNEEQYTPEEYVRIKKSFFENIPIDEDCKCVFGLTSFSREEFNQLLRLNNHPKFTYGTKHVCEVRHADYSSLDCLLYDMNSSLNGLDMKIRIKNQSYNFKTNVILPFNALNFTCAITILEALNILDAEKFNKVIDNIKIPGRDEIIRVNNRSIIIGLSIMPALEIFKNNKISLGLNNLKVVTGAVGTGYVNWNKIFHTEEYLSKISGFRQFAMNYVKEYADYAYLTSCDNAAENPLNIAQEMQSYLNNRIPSTIEIDRYEAIKKAIVVSETNDLIYIAGRGNRRIFCDSANTMKLIQDKEVVLEVLNNLGWKINGQ